MRRTNHEEGRHRVLLLGIGDNTDEEKKSFCQNTSEKFNIPFPLLKKIVDHCPVVLKKYLSFKKAEILARAFSGFGARVVVEERKDFTPVFLEYHEMHPRRLALESSDLRRTQSGAWNIIGRVKNISEESLHEVWIIIQLFDELDEFLTFEEVPLPINPLPPGVISPFKVVFEGSLSIKKISMAFKNSLGNLVPATDRRKRREWVEVEMKPRDEWGPPSLSVTEPPERKCLEEGTSIEEQRLDALEPEPIPLSFEEVEEKIGEGLEREGDQSVLSEREEVVSFEIVSESSERAEDLILKILDQDEAVGNGLKLFPTLRPTLPPPFPWLETFRASIEAYEPWAHDMFSDWFKTRRDEEGFETPLHSLLTLLVHARFEQKGESDKALENTRRVFKQIAQPDLRFEDIPLLEGTPFSPGEQWRDLFHRAFPKIVETAKRIHEKKVWRAEDLERLIQIIPHTGNQNSRMAVRWIKAFIPEEVLEIDFSNARVQIEESLYRVVARLGVVDPHFDLYQGINSMADLKIQSFAKAVFPEYPVKIERPLTWVGRAEEGGFCLPIQPRCEGCPCEAFCPKHYLHFNPSEKGMKEP